MNHLFDFFQFKLVLGSLLNFWLFKLFALVFYEDSVSLLRRGCSWNNFGSWRKFFKTECYV